jgi:Flp pilus assembly protein TadG
MLGQLIRNRSGAAAVEMALVAPLLIAIMFGAMELGYYFYSEHVVVKAVRDGARFASRQTFDHYDCATSGVDTTVQGETQRVTRTDRVASGGAARLASWTSDASVSVTMRAAPLGTYGSFYGGMTCIPVVVVSATVPYASLFSLLGFNAVNLQLRATSEVPVMGV